MEYGPDYQRRRELFLVWDGKLYQEKKDVCLDGFRRENHNKYEEGWNAFRRGVVPDM